MSDNPGGDEPGLTNSPVRFLEPGVFPLTSTTTTTLNILRGRWFWSRNCLPTSMLSGFYYAPGKLKWTPTMEVWKKSFLFNWVIFRFQPLIFRGFMFYCNLRKKHIIFPWKSTWPTPRKNTILISGGMALGGWHRLDFHESLNLESTTWVKVNMLFRRRIWLMGIGGQVAAALQSSWPWFRVHGFQGECESLNVVLNFFALLCVEVDFPSWRWRRRSCILHLAAGTLPNVVDIWALPNMMPSHKIQENQHPILLLQGLRCSCSCWLLLHTPPLPQKT